MNQLNTCPQLTPPALITPTLTLTSLLAAHTWSTTLLLGFTTREASRPHTGRVSRARHHSHHTPHRPCTVTTKEFRVVTTIPQQQQLIVAFEVSLIGYYYLAHGIYCITTCYSLLILLFIQIKTVLTSSSNTITLLIKMHTLPARLPAHSGLLWEDVMTLLLTLEWVCTLLVDYFAGQPLHCLSPTYT